MSAIDPHPQLLPGVRLHHDRHRDQWVLLAPERVLELDPVAHAIVSRCDGSQPLSAIVDGLARDFDAPREVIEADVRQLLDQLAGKGLLQR